MAENEASPRPPLSEEIVEEIVNAISEVLDRHGIRLRLPEDGDELASPDTVGA